jgi:hypothetical protein
MLSLLSLDDLALILLGYTVDMEATLTRHQRDRIPIDLNLDGRSRSKMMCRNRINQTVWFRQVHWIIGRA